MAALMKASARLWLLSFGLLAISLFILTPSFKKTQPDAHLRSRNILNDLSKDRSLAGNVSTTDSTCKKGIRCKKNACCGGFFGGDEGTCGFGPDFCGNDCDSQCNAKPECGQYADPPNKQCPLNVCCSSYGYCGTSSEFCKSGCQSNCVLEPSVPKGGSNIGVIQNKVIGYYQSWADRRSCHSFPPDAIPVEGLTHLNFAFAYIDPHTLEITSMDEATPEALFARTTGIKNTKSRNADLEVFVSIGGWTFSDNNTATQPLFSEIAADSDKRQTFADNLVQFMVRYGFDGVDLDWEYPGATDRGGNSNDTQNFVELLKTLRSTFDSSARGSYGLTFTIPTSYWYLRWFDVPGLLKYADWTNMMSYDLHGVWDEHNPIGSKVHGHTNLTEIKTASELLWRNNIAPSKVVLGVGFYGRSFHLADTRCTTPGCPFKDDAQEGDCTKASGTLAYFEIMDIIEKQNINVTYDGEAAVNYITFGDEMDQWVSYDSNKTFQQKVDYANKVGMGGVMIWSVDQDDNSFSALQSLIGNSLPSFQNNLKRSTTVDANHWKSLNGESCSVSDCIASDSSPPSGYGLAPDGKFSDKCSGGKFKFVWCPLNQMPSTCTWRGSGSCHGQCHEAEVTLTHSSHGSKKCISPGQQAFCCESNTWAKLGAAQCGWSDDCETCPNERPYAVSSKKVGLFRKCNIPWCCAYDFENCHWVGKGTCDDNECAATDVQVGLDPSGNTGNKCANGWSNRQKPLCCNAPKNSNPFLPVPLANLFPTLPPTEDVPAWDKQSIKNSAGDAKDAFFFVLVDGPADAVTNVNKRDGSHIEFVTGGVHHGQAAQTAHFVCLDDSADSNCDDMHFHGLEGKVLRMPDGLGFAKYAVAHSVTVSNYTVPHDRLSKRAPEGARVHELTYSYNFAKVKRDTSGPIYLRVDYADSKKYWDQVVEGSPKSKRDLKPRFWSKALSVWKDILKKLRTVRLPGNNPSMSNPKFDVSIYESDGSSQGCGNSGWLKVNLKGRIVSVFRFGFSLVGTLQPFKLEEAYGYFDSGPWIDATLDFDGKGILDINHGRGVIRDLFSSPVTGFEGSHPGIISFSPQLNADISMVGSGEIDAKFSAHFDGGSASELTTHAPPSLGDFDGSAMPSTTIKDPVTGNISVGSNAPNTVFALNVNLESAMEMKIFEYGSSSVKSGARFTSRTPRTLRVVSDTGSGKPGLVIAPQQATSDVVSLGSELVASSWNDDKTYPVGLRPSQFTIFIGGDNPPDRKAPEMNGSPIFTENNLIACTDIEWSGSLTCTYDLLSNQPGLTEPSPPYRKRGELLGADAQHLEPRAGGPSGGNRELYPVYQYPPVGGSANYFRFETPTYPNGDNGRHLNDARGHIDAYSLANPLDCQDPSITDQGVQGVNYDYLDSEHPIDRSVIPNHFLNFAQSGRLDLADNTYHVTNLPTWDWDDIFRFWHREYRHWVNPNLMDIIPPGSASADVADALGSSSNPDQMTNLERALNRLKGQMYTTESSGASDATWADWLLNPSQANSQEALTSIRSMFAVFHYMQAIRRQREATNEGIIAALETFDQIFSLAHPNDPRRMAPLFREFQPAWESRVINYHSRVIRGRLREMATTYRQLLQNPGSQRAVMATRVLAQIQQYQRRVQTDLHF